MAKVMNGAVLRLLDANVNRAREALRVMEDYARFVLDDADLSAALKAVRHDLSEAMRPWIQQAILWRDTPGDVGTINKTATELHRQDLADVVTAAGKRLGEALRSIEEYLKISAPADAGRVEGARYRFYDLEQRIARTLRSSHRFDSVRLYVLITEAVCRRPWLEVAEQALLGGADCLQLREKEMDAGEMLRRARLLAELCHKHSALCVINDRPDIALLSGGDGVHVGQGDLPALEARKIVGADKLIGVSTHNLEQAQAARRDGADYIGIGPCFVSDTKRRDFVAGLDVVRQVAQDVSIPAVAIAGITATNVDEVLKTGIRAIAVTAAICAADDPRKAAEELKKRLNQSGGQTFLSVAAENKKSENEKVGQTFLSVSNAPSVTVTGGQSANEHQLSKTRRKLPHWQLDGSTYFVTFRLRSGIMDVAERAIVLNHVRSGDEKYYKLIAATIMPDHVHAMIVPKEGWDLSRVMKGMKGVAARLLNQHRDSRGILWQEESWDRIMRDQAEVDQKLKYMLENSVKRGLVADPWEYDGWYYGGQED